MNLAEEIKKLPPEIRQEVENFIQSLLAKHLQDKPAKPTLEWRGALRDMRGKFTSVELQHHLSDSWGD